MIAPDGIPTKSSLEFWVNTERYQAFPKVAGGNINDVAEMGKILVMVAIDENDKENEKVNSRFVKHVLLYSLIYKFSFKIIGIVSLPTVAIIFLSQKSDLF